MTMEKHYDPAEAEKRVAALWEQAGCFRAGAGAEPGAEPFCIVIPPPNVTGSLHMGHALNNTLQDILVRWKRMQGHDVLWQPGTDHAGIATQMVVERKLAAEQQPSRRDLGREEFLRRVWDWKAESGGTIVNQLKRLGASCDWTRERFTMDEGLSRAVARVFTQLFKEGLITRAKSLVNWDPHFETAISDIEVEQVDVKGKLWRFRYPLADGISYRHPVEFDEEGRPTAWEERNYLVVATTRPETMLGDMAVAVNPKDARYADLVGKFVDLPLVLTNRRIPVIADDYADPATGTGAVKITPAHDFNDFDVWKRFVATDPEAAAQQLWNILTPSAKLKADASFEDQAKDGSAPAEGWVFERIPEELRGLDREEARKRVVLWFEAQGLLDGIDDHPHKVPHGDRSKVVIEPYLTNQWFVDAKKLAAQPIQDVQNGATKFFPANWDKTFFHWMENIQPWCVSRQLWWGHQIPVWTDEDGDLYCEETETQAYEAARAAKGPGVRLTQDPDVLDTWFSSALWPFSTLGWPDQTPELAKYYPNSVLITGFDILFFWVARMMMMGTHFMEETPFPDVYLHALVRDEKGRKMSKSVGNVIDPLVMIDKYGADATRFTLASMAAMGRDIRLAEGRIEGSRNFVTKLWNAARFCEMNQCFRVAGFDPKSVKQASNRWIVGETARAREALDAALSAYRFNDYANTLYAHIWNVFCDWHLEFAKPLLASEDEAVQAETRAVTAWALAEILKLLHPAAPFVTEELWRLTGGEDALALTRWPTYAAADFAEAGADDEMGWIVAFIEGVRSARNEVNVPPSAQLELVLTDFTQEAALRMQRNGALIRRLARLSELAVASKPPAGALAVTLRDGVAHLPVAGVIDVAAERARLEKAVEKAAKEESGLAGRLSNEAFRAKAPPEVIEEQEERLGQLRADLERLRGALGRLAGMEKGS
ncbi:valine--tRNA ligase [Neomegalonema perideroedes]|uniref:valine--tRNA ligase n=1 Tax=Neomegalonema perideroedes TaxID=217219 RepID=UPI00037E38E3|nr:valine--tRNA ligase [Neomegalonema perideroedes]